MMVRAYLEWSINASAQDRAEAVGILADVFLDAELSAETRRDAEAALILALDDPAADVRRMLAQKLGASERAPRALVAVLSEDRPDIAAVVVANSPLLSDPVLVDLLALGEEPIQLAVAERATVTEAVAAAIAEVGSAEAVAALVSNDGACMPLFSLRRAIERFPDDGSLRERLLERGDLPPDVRVRLVQNAASQLTRFATECGWLSDIRGARLAQDCIEGGTVAVACEAPCDDVAPLVAALRASGALTPQLLLRSLLSGETRLLTATLAELAGVSHAKASGLVHGRGGIGFRALYRKAGLPQRLEPAFEAALSAWHDFGTADGEAGRLSLRMIERVLTSVAVLDDAESGKLLALLVRYQAEAARCEARAAVADLLAEPAPPVELDREDLELRLQDALQIEFKQAA